MTLAFLPALRAAAPDITEAEAGQILTAVNSAGRIDSLAGWVHSPAGRLDIPARLARMRTAPATWADVPIDTGDRPEPCTDCRGGWLGNDDQDRPIPCPRCRPHTQRGKATA